MKILIASFAALLTSACAPPLVESVPSATTSEPTPCRAERYQGYVGRNRADLPPRPAGETWRVACTTCAMTMDYSPTRLNILYEERTGVIREVKCG
jgi:hypothetical protein